MIERRRFLSFSAAGAGALLVSPRMALAGAETDRRFVFVIQRGAADGLDIVRPFGDPAFEALRNTVAGAPEASLALDGFFRLHPAMPTIAQMYGDGEALFAHAVASPYRDRSHFDGQNVLETGGTAPYAVKDGWLNRLVAMLPPRAGEAIALAATVPMALRGPERVGSYAPSALTDPSDDLIARLTSVYEADDQLHGIWDAALESNDIAGRTARGQDPGSLGRLAAKFLSEPNGPRIAMIETSGWDTHYAQARRLDRQLKGLDTLIGQLKAGLGETWRRTTVLVATEFGRTAAINGTGGSDHGTASAALVLGGAVKGGRVLADWPGLGPQALYQSRDLRPTTGLDALIAALSAESFALDPQEVARRLFGGTSAGSGLSGLVA